MKFEAYVTVGVGAVGKMKRQERTMASISDMLS